MEKESRCVLIDAARFTSKADLFETFREALGVDTMGHNLDALHDVLTAVAEPTEIRVQNFDGVWQITEAYLSRLTAVLAVSASENPMLTVVFC